MVNTLGGVYFSPTETNGRPNGLINWQLGPSNHSSFRSQGTFSLDIFADRNSFVTGFFAKDNFGFNQFNNGQSSISFVAARVDNGTGLADDQLRITWDSWHSNVWHNHGFADLEMNQWYDIGFTWLGPDNPFELWVNGALAASDNVSPNAA